MRKSSLQGSLMLLLTALIWGLAFVAQSVGMEYVGPFTFNAVRFLIGGFVLMPCIALLRHFRPERVSLQDRSSRKKISLQGGLACGCCLFAASSLQQIGIMTTTVGKAGFITAMYIVFVPILGIFLGKRVTLPVIGGVLLAVAGMYLLCITDGLSIGRGDLLVLFCAVVFAVHILVIDHYSPKGDGLMISCVQFLTAGLLSTVCMLACETPQLSDILAAGAPILYAGILSCGVAYTLQVLAQAKVEPVLASLICSLESVFALLGGWVLLGQQLSGRELLGCLLVFAAVLIVQLL